MALVALVEQSVAQYSIAEEANEYWATDCSTRATRGDWQGNRQSSYATINSRLRLLSDNMDGRDNKREQCLSTFRPREKAAYTGPSYTLARLRDSLLRACCPSLRIAHWNPSASRSAENSYREKPCRSSSREILPSLLMSSASKMADTVRGLCPLPLRKLSSSFGCSTKDL